MTVGLALRLVAVMVLWAACFPLITIGLDLAAHLAFAAMRAALAGLCLCLLGVLLHRPLPRGGRCWALVVLVGVGATSLGFLGMFHAAEFVSPGLATVIANAQPLLAVVLAHVFLRERLTVIGKLGLMAGLAGIGAIAWPGLASGDGGNYSVGIAYVILAAMGVSIGNIAIKRLGAGRGHRARLGRDCCRTTWRLCPCPVLNARAVQKAGYCVGADPTQTERSKGCCCA